MKMKAVFRHFFPVVALPLSCLILLFPFAVLGQPSAIEQGLIWLDAQQGADGFWEPYSSTRALDSAYIVSVLRTMNSLSEGCEMAVQAIEASTSFSIDYNARLAKAQLVGPGNDFPGGQLTLLASAQNGDGGWGFGRGYESNTLDTALAVQALSLAGEDFSSRISDGVGYLLGAQNVDHGWSFHGEAGSELMVTRAVIDALHWNREEEGVGNSLVNCGSWIANQVQVDGGAGCDDYSTVSETGHALVGLVKCNPSSFLLGGMKAYLEAEQQPNGSWSESAYLTGLALDALNQIGPNLHLNPGDVFFSEAAPTDTSVVDVNVVVSNLGAQQANNVLVEIYDGFRDGEGLQIGNSVYVAHLAAGSDTTITAQWEVDYGFGIHQIVAYVDPENSIVESDDLDNVAICSVQVLMPPDLEVAGISFTPETPETYDSVVVSTTVANDGQLPADNVTLQIYDGDPDAGGIALMASPYVVTSLAPGAQFTLNLNTGNYFNTEGGHDIFARCDVSNWIREFDEENNTRQETLWVGIRCEPVAVRSDLNLLGLPLTPSDQVSAFGVLAEVDNGLEIHGWDATTQTWQSAFDLGGGAPAGDDFAIGLMDGFFARTSDPGVATFCGTRTQEHGCVDLLPGLNLVSVAHPDACYSGFHFLDSIDDCLAAYSWDSTTQAWLTALDAGSGNPTGDDFVVGPGGGYFVKVSGPSTWCTVNCDTVSALPDPALTQASIYCDPATVPSGSSTNVYISVGNSGTVAFANPRIDLAFGDPDAGGSYIGYFIMPETIAPGGASPFYFVSIPVSGSVSLDIYAVLDRLGEMEELDENNNKAFTTVNFSETLKGQVGSPTQGAGKPLPVLPRPPQQAGPRPPLPPSSLPGPASPVLADKAEGPAKAVTSLTHVLAANLSSAAATVFWATDECAYGRVDYGTTPALGMSEYQEAGCSDVHQVVLTGLVPETTYYYQVESGELLDNNEGALYSFTTSSSGAGLPGVVAGAVADGTSLQPLPDVLVQITLSHEDETSTPLATITDAAGNWLLNLGNFKSTTTGAVLAWSAGDGLEVDYAYPGLSLTSLDTTLTGTSPQMLGTALSQAGESAAPDLVPARPYLAANVPNPFNPLTTIRFGITRPGPVDLAVYDVSGRLVATLAHETYPAGRHEVAWQGRDQTGRRVASGVYFYRLKTDEFSDVQKMLLIK